MRPRDWGYVLGREIGVATALGVTVGAAVWLLGLTRAAPEVAAVVAIAMVLVVVAGSLIGMALPVLLQRCKLDPATASTPLVTSLADIAGLLIYFGVAVVLLDLPVAA
ncbi:magnesium transporter [Alkalilimnicola ehrlichii]|uniref:magnesium transporter n=1 Tax=Alkalilimnicola ehrlichii TaxID=351052 RepID=UPI0015F24E7F|nr:magnesium transporter [Alkalilimnicola ehrlichii]